MKISKYTFVFDTNNTEFYLYNTLSNALIEIDQDSYQYLLKAKNNKSDVEISSEIEEELHNILINKRFITENEKDDFLYYKSTLMRQRADQSFMHVTIAPQ